jgi:hypothetical protein
LTVQPHQALPVLKGFPGRDHAFITELADRLQIRPHGMIGLVDRQVRRRWYRAAGVLLWFLINDRINRSAYRVIDAPLPPPIA